MQGGDEFHFPHQLFARRKKSARQQSATCVTAAILNVEQADRLDQIRALRRLSGSSGYYRIRIGDWRIGLKVDGGTVTFVRCLHRREIYRFFP